MMIYIIKNTMNGKSYIGQTIHHGMSRWKEHCRKARSNSRNLGPFHSAIKKYGSENFIISFIELPKDADQEDLNSAEKFYISELNTLVPNGYNLSPGGGTGALHPETKLKIGRVLTGRKGPRLGVKVTEESRGRMSESHLGKKMPLEVREKIKKANTGKKRTQETKDRIRISHTGRKFKFKSPRSEADRKAISERKKGKSLSEEIKEKIRITAKKNAANNPVSEETRRKISEGVKKAKAKQRIEESCIPFVDVSLRKLPNNE